MRVIILCTLLCILTTSISLTAPSKKPVVRNIKIMKASSISKLKQITYPTPAKLIINGGMLVRKTVPEQPTPESGSNESSTAGNEAYRTGSGLVLRPSAMSHPASRSHLSLLYVNTGKETLSTLNGHSPDDRLGLFFPCMRDVPPADVVVGWFYDLPGGMHTYIVTLGLRADAIMDHLSITIGYDTFQGDDLFYSESTGDIRLLFSYDAGARDNNNKAIVCVKWNHNDSAREWYYQELQFYYIQLAQLD